MMPWIGEAGALIAAFFVDPAQSQQQIKSLNNFDFLLSTRPHRIGSVRGFVEGVNMSLTAVPAQQLVDCLTSTRMTFDALSETIVDRIINASATPGSARMEALLAIDQICPAPEFSAPPPNPFAKKGEALIAASPDAISDDVLKADRCARLFPSMTISFGMPRN